MSGKFKSVFFLTEEEKEEINLLLDNNTLHKKRKLAAKVILELDGGNISGVKLSDKYSVTKDYIYSLKRRFIKRRMKVFYSEPRFNARRVTFINVSAFRNAISRALNNNNGRLDFDIARKYLREEGIVLSVSSIKKYMVQYGVCGCNSISLTNEERDKFLYLLDNNIYSNYYAIKAMKKYISSFS